MPSDLWLGNVSFSTNFSFSAFLTRACHSISVLCTSPIVHFYFYHQVKAAFKDQLSPVILQENIPATGILLLRFMYTASPDSPENCTYKKIYCSEKVNTGHQDMKKVMFKASVNWPTALALLLGKIMVKFTIEMAPAQDLFCKSIISERRCHTYYF